VVCSAKRKQRSAGSEAALQRRVLRWLRARPKSWTIKVPGTVLTGGLPDVFHVERGRFYAFELKAPRGRVTPLQALCLNRIRAAGGVAVVARSLDDVRRVLEGDGDPAGRRRERRER